MRPSTEIEDIFRAANPSEPFTPGPHMRAYLEWLDRTCGYKTNPQHQPTPQAEAARKEAEYLERLDRANGYKTNPQHQLTPVRPIHQKVADLTFHPFPVSIGDYLVMKLHEQEEFQRIQAEEAKKEAARKEAEARRAANRKFVMGLLPGWQGGPCGIYAPDDVCGSSRFTYANAAVTSAELENGTQAYLTGAASRVLRAYADRLSAPEPQCQAGSR